MRTRTTTRDSEMLWSGAAAAQSPQRVRWGAVFAGAILGLALLLLLTAFWFALGFGTGVDAIQANMEWYIGISAIVALFVGGLIAGWLSGVHGAGSGFFNGATIWGLMLVTTITVGVPATLNVFNIGQVVDQPGGVLQAGAAENVLWASFVAILVGFVAAGLGGIVGGLMTRPANAHLADAGRRETIRERDYGRDYDRGYDRDREVPQDYERSYERDRELARDRDYVEDDVDRPARPDVRDPDDTEIRRRAS
jgi:hypothetical protein